MKISHNKLVSDFATKYITIYKTVPIVYQSRTRIVFKFDDETFLECYSDSNDDFWIKSKIHGIVHGPFRVDDHATSAAVNAVLNTKTADAFIKMIKRSADSNEFKDERDKPAVADPRFNVIERPSEEILRYKLLDRTYKNPAKIHQQDKKEKKARAKRRKN